MQFATGEATMEHYERALKTAIEALPSYLECIDQPHVGSVNDGKIEALQCEFATTDGTVGVLLSAFYHPEYGLMVEIDVAYL